MSEILRRGQRLLFLRDNRIEVIQSVRNDHTVGYVKTDHGVYTYYDIIQGLRFLKIQLVKERTPRTAIEPTTDVVIPETTLTFYADYECTEESGSLIIYYDIAHGSGNYTIQIKVDDGWARLAEFTAVHNGTGSISIPVTGDNTYATIRITDLDKEIVSNESGVFLRNCVQVFSILEVAQDCTSDGLCLNISYYAPIEIYSIVVQ